MNFKTYISIVFLLFQFSLIGQENNQNDSFFVEVKIVVEDTNEAIKNATVSVNGRYFQYSEIYEYYKVSAKINDQLSVSHPDFDDVYYTITSNEEVKIVIKGTLENTKRFSSLKKKSQDTYLQYLDSAKFYTSKNIDKSLNFVEKAIKNGKTKERNAASYKTLADIYLFWKQYDLAIYNYKLSNQISKNTTTQIQLAKAYFLAKDYVNSKKTYTELKNKELGNYPKVLVLEGLGDVAFATKNYSEAKNNYNSAFNFAKEQAITSKITDISSKLATVFSAQGNIPKAKNQFNNSLNFAAKESEKRVLEEEEKVADFLNENKKYDEEIVLRKKSLLKTNTIKLDTTFGFNANEITAQKINYKIGTAYLLKEQYEEAIPFLEKSRTDAEKKKDIVVEKDATRKISEVFASLGNEEKALENYKAYVALVDTLYIRKEQEIQQVKRFSKKIADNQNRIASLEKDKELAQSKISLAYTDTKLSEESNKRQRQIIYSLIGGFLLMILLVYFMYRNSKQQKLANNLLALKSMRSQMNPHFIFNALNSVNSFIAVNDERNANRYLSEFSVLMRSVLENSDEDFIPLNKEIELLELYVKLEHNRFKNKFNYQINVDKNIDLEQFEIPPMLLQPYIENAIWHGLRYRKEVGNLEINIQKKDAETIVISIVDDGIGREKSQALKTENQLKQKSKGMSTIKNRIAILNDMYKERISVHVSSVLENGEGTKVELYLKKA